MALAPAAAKRYLFASFVNLAHMARRLPPLSTLRPFEAAARLERFTRAAEELHLTHGAVSHQVRALEEHLGVPLFARHGMRVALTAARRSLD